MKPVSVSLILVIALPLASQNAVTADLAGKSVELTLVRADDLSIAAFPPEPVKLKSVPVIFTAETNTYLLLQSHGIAPDPESFAAIYELNPTISDVNTLASGAKIILPSVIPGPRLRAMLRHGYLVAITLEPRIRRSLNDRIAILQTFSSSINSLTDDPEAQSQLRDLIDWYGRIHARYIRRTEPPLRHDTLAALNDEAGALVAMLQYAAQKHSPLTSVQLAQLNALHADLHDDIVQYNQVLSDVAPRAQTAYKITVRVLGASEPLASTLRVYYTYNGLFQPPPPAKPPLQCYPFDQLGSTVTGTLTLKNYRIWAARDGHPNDPLTPPLLLKIDGVTPTELTVDLRIQKEPSP